MLVRIPSSSILSVREYKIFIALLEGLHSLFFVADCRLRKLDHLNPLEICFLVLFRCDALGSQFSRQNNQEQTSRFCPVSLRIVLAKPLDKLVTSKKFKTIRSLHSSGLLLEFETIATIAILVFDF